MPLDKITFVYPWTGQVAVFSFGFSLPSLSSSKCPFMSWISSLSSLSPQHDCMPSLWSFGFFSAVLLDQKYRATLVSPWPVSCAAVPHALLSTPFSSSFSGVDVILGAPGPGGRRFSINLLSTLSSLMGGKRQSHPFLLGSG